MSAEEEDRREFLTGLGRKMAQTFAQVVTQSPANFLSQVFKNVLKGGSSGSVPLPTLKQDQKDLWKVTPGERVLPVGLKIHPLLRTGEPINSKGHAFPKGVRGFAKCRWHDYNSPARDFWAILNEKYLTVFEVESPPSFRLCVESVSNQKIAIEGEKTFLVGSTPWRSILCGSYKEGKFFLVEIYPSSGRIREIPIQNQDPAFFTGCLFLRNGEPGFVYLASEKQLLKIATSESYFDWNQNESILDRVEETLLEVDWQGMDDLICHPLLGSLYGVMQGQIYFLGDSSGLGPRHELTFIPDGYERHEIVIRQVCWDSALGLLIGSILIKNNQWAYGIYVQGGAPHNSGHLFFKKINKESSLPRIVTGGDGSGFFLAEPLSEESPSEEWQVSAVELPK